MNRYTDQSKPKIKERRPVIAALLSMFSLGLGQVYNGQLLRGVVLNLLFWTAWGAHVFYTSDLYFGSSWDLVFLLMLIGWFLLLKGYSIIQAVVHARGRRETCPLRWFNHVGVYLLFTLLFLVPPFQLSTMVKTRALETVSAAHPFRSSKAQNQFLSTYDARAAEWPVASTTRAVETAYGSTFVRVSGPESAPPLVLLHGGPSNSLQWIYNIEALSKNHRAYAIDIIIGTGRSVYTRNITRESGLVEWLDETLTRLNLNQKPHLMGLSYGGWLAAVYATAHQDRLASLILAAPVMTVDGLSFTWIRYALLAIIPHPSFMKDFFYWLMPDFAAAYPREMGRVVDEAFLAQRCFKPKMPVNPTILSAGEWSDLRIPVLLIVGAKEKIYPRPARRVIARMRRIAPGIQTELVHGAGHDLTIVRARSFEKRVLDFLSGLEKQH